MKKSRVLAVVMAVLMMVTLLPSMVFATAVPSGTLDGKLKVKGTLAIGSTLSADYSKVKPEGITDDNVSFSWSLKDGDLLTEVGTDKTYKIAEKDLGLPIVLKITGKEETGVSGELTKQRRKPKHWQKRKRKKPKQQEKIRMRRKVKLRSLQRTCRIQKLERQRSLIVLSLRKP